MLPRDFNAIAPDPNGSTTFSALATGDFNGDKNLDIIVAHSDHNTGMGFVEVLMGNGDGTLRAPITTLLNFNATYFFGVGDFNGDSNGHIGNNTTFDHREPDGAVTRGW